jgi:hypothetical protein
VGSGGAAVGSGGAAVGSGGGSLEAGAGSSGGCGGAEVDVVDVARRGAEPARGRREQKSAHPRESGGVLRICVAQRALPDAACALAGCQIGGRASIRRVVLRLLSSGADR